MVHMSPELVPRAYPYLFTNLRYTVYIYLKKIKIMYFIFVLFFLGHPRHPPPGLKKKQQQQIILRGSGACKEAISFPEAQHVAG